tara:strand:+ start:377 stop:967 length:591 start_codon:yes stop_codon:yes gene_type:complete
VNNLTPIFSSFYTRKNLNSIIDVKQFEVGAYECARNDSGIHVSNCGGYHSSVYSQFNDSKQNLIDIIDFEIDEVAKELELKSKLKVSAFWYNISGNKDFNKIHSHMKSVLSGVYYVKVPKNSGGLVFDCPQSELMMSYLSYWHIDYNPNQYTSKTWTVLPEEGDLVIFPSWLSHYTEPNMSTDDRISISFNTSLCQ